MGEQSETRPADVSVLINEPKGDSLRNDTFHIHIILQSDRGLWQLSHWFIFMLTALCCSWQTFTPAFLVPVSGCASFTSNLTNVTHAGKTINGISFLLQQITHEESTCFDSAKLRNCSGRDNDAISTKDRIIKCSFEENGEFSDTLSEEVAFYGTKHLVAAAKSVYMFGGFVGIILVQPVVSRFGQRCAVFGGFLLFYLCSVSACFTSSMQIFLALRFFISLGITSVFWITLGAMLESVVPYYRLIYGVIGYLGWSIGYMILPVIAWCTTDWFSFQASTSIPCLLLAVPLCFLPESVNYLLHRGKVKETIEMVKSALMKDNRYLDDINEICHQSYKTLIKKSRDSKGNAFLRLKAHLGYRNLLFYGASFMISLLYYVLSWDFYQLPGDPFTNFSWAGAMETLSVFLLMFFGYFMAQRLLLLLTVIGASIFPVAGMWMATGEIWISLHSYMAAKFFVTGALTLTVIRGFEESGLLVTAAVTSLGSALAPFMEEMIVGDSGGTVMAVLCSACLILGILSALFQINPLKFSLIQ